MMYGQGETRKKSEPQMGFEPTTLRVLEPHCTVGTALHGYTVK